MAYSGLVCAAQIELIFENQDRYSSLTARASQLQTGIETYLWIEEDSGAGYYARSLDATTYLPDPRAGTNFPFLS